MCTYAYVCTVYKVYTVYVKQVTEFLAVIFKLILYTKRAAPAPQHCLNMRWRKVNNTIYIYYIYLNVFDSLCYKYKI